VVYYVGGGYATISGTISYPLGDMGVIVMFQYFPISLAIWLDSPLSFPFPFLSLIYKMAIYIFGRHDTKCNALNVIAVGVKSLCSR